MATFRVIKEAGNFVTVHKEFIQDEKLSWKAKGILLYLLSRPDDWQIYESELLKHCSDGKNSLSSGIKELEKVGYISRERKRDEKGYLQGYEYTVREKPIHITKSNVGKSNVGKSDTTNNNITNNKNTNNYKTVGLDFNSHNINNSHQTNLSNVIDDDDAYLKIFERISQYEINPNNVLVNSLSKKSNQIDLGIILWAIDTGYNNGIKKPNNYIKAIVDRKIKHGITTLAKHEQQEKEWQVKNSKPNQFMTESEKQERIEIAQQMSNNPNAVDELNNQSLGNPENPFSQFKMD